MKSLFSLPTHSSRDLLNKLLFFHFLGTLAAYTIYIRLSSLGDGYDPGNFQGFSDRLSSTSFTHFVYVVVGSALPGFLAPMALGFVVAILTWYAFRNIYTLINPKLFWTCCLFPHFLIWSGSSSKEQLVIISGIIVIHFAAKSSFGLARLGGTSILLLPPLWVIYFIRPNYFIIYLTVFATSIAPPFLKRYSIKSLSLGIWFFVSIFFLLMTFLFFLDSHPDFFSTDVVSYMIAVETSFLAYTSAGSNRLDIQWQTFSDFLINSFWGIPQGFIGPTITEALSKPVLLPVFVEGVVYIFILCFLMLSMIKLSLELSFLRSTLVPYLLVTAIIVFISYPYLIFNPGSALRYKQSLAPILFFYPLSIIGYAKKLRFKRYY